MGLEYDVAMERIATLRAEARAVNGWSRAPGSGTALARRPGGRTGPAAGDREWPWSRWSRWRRRVHRPVVAARM